MVFRCGIVVKEDIEMADELVAPFTIVNTCLALNPWFNNFNGQPRKEMEASDWLPAVLRSAARRRALGDQASLSMPRRLDAYADHRAKAMTRKFLLVSHSKTLSPAAS